MPKPSVPSTQVVIIVVFIVTTNRPGRTSSSQATHPRTNLAIGWRRLSQHLTNEELGEGEDRVADLTKDLGIQTRLLLMQMLLLCTLDLKVDQFAKKGIRREKDTRPGDVVPINATDLLTYIDNLRKRLKGGRDKMKRETDTLTLTRFLTWDSLAFIIFSFGLLIGHKFNKNDFLIQQQKKQRLLQ